MNPLLKTSWWNADEGEVWKMSIPYVRTVENTQASFFDKCVKLESSYDTNPRTNRYISADVIAGRLRGKQRAVITQNLIATNVDTVAASVADSDIDVRIETDGADWSHQRMAKWMERYANGLAELLEVGPKCRRGFKVGAAVKGTGLNKVWIDQFDRIRVTPVPIDNIIVDELESRDIEPRQMHYRDFLDREDLMAQYPDHADRIVAAQGNGSWRLWAGYRPIEVNTLVVIESWRLPIGPQGHKHYRAGRHVISIDGCDLFDEEYHDDFFPFPLMRWNDPVTGFYGISLAERILPFQNLLNRRNYQINASLDRKADPITYVKRADMELATKTVAQIGPVAVYNDALPVTVDHQAVGQETYADANSIPGKASAEAGVNQGMASGGVPGGIESGVGVREVRQTRVQRFSSQEEAFERFWLDTIWQILNCCKKLGDKAPKILRVSKFNGPDIPWDEVNMDDLRIQLAAASTLSDSPAGRQQRVVELAQAGVITLDESRQLMDHPDIDRVISMYNASVEGIESALEDILDGESVIPTPYMNLQQCATMGQAMYLKLDAKKGKSRPPEEILERLADWISVAADLLNPPAPPQMTGEVPMDSNAPPMPGAMPGAPAAQGVGAFAQGAFQPMSA